MNLLATTSERCLGRGLLASKITYYEEKGEELSKNIYIPYARLTG